ncbi:MAG: CCA tRNA nucleotidyltransferase [Methanobacteriota archaeon]|nr:MAG: CCA tRNA nucleotidyltransferase [Euryarchaeota archaeon]
MGDNTRRLEAVCEKVVEKVRPTADQDKRLREIYNLISGIITKFLSDLGVEASVMLTGSVAKGTHLSHDQDLDIFILFPVEKPLEDIKRLGLEVGERVASELGVKPERRYAQHPYTRLQFRDVRVDIVPAYNTEKGTRIITAVDRTPHHTEYVKKSLSEEQKDHTRVLKEFLRANNLYGTENMVGGFSGYLCELLIHHYGTFPNLVSHARRWTPPVVHVYAPDQIEPCDSPLVVQDPVDPRRNVAAATTTKAFSHFVVLANMFYEQPSEKFFTPIRIDASAETVKRVLSEKGTTLVSVVLERLPPIAEDNLWPQLEKSARYLRKKLVEQGFPVIHTFCWAGQGRAIIFLESQSVSTHPIRFNLGPHITTSWEKQRAYLGKRVSSGDVVAGPYLVGDRWVSETRREEINIVEGVRRILEKGHGLGRQIRKALRGSRVSLDPLEAATSGEVLNTILSEIRRDQLVQRFRVAHGCG